MKKSNKEEFIKKSYKIHKNKYDYSKVDYKNNITNILIICPLHGIFNQMPKVHLRGGACKKCADIISSSYTRKKIEQFTEQANLKHSDFYNYSKFIYKDAHSKGIIICPVHGEFEQDAHSHLKGSKCSKCSKEQADKWGWSKSKWIEKASLKTPQLYVVRLYNDNEEFIKVGITSKLKAKYRLVQIPYNCEVLLEYKDKAEIIWNLENQIKKNLRKQNKYLPKIFFKGMYECYNINILDQILKEIKHE